MLKKLHPTPRVLAYQFSGAITADDVDSIYDDLKAAFEDHDKVSVYAEMIGDFDFDRAAAWRDLSRAPEVLKHFRDFERVAFIAEPSWITALARIEQKILSLFKFEMHVFDPSEKERAMAWVTGQIEDKQAPSIREIPSFAPNLAIFEIDGKIRQQDMLVAKDIMLKFLDDDQPRNLMAIIKDFGGFELGLLADSDLFRLKIEAAKHLDRYAIVGAPKWLEGYIATMDAVLKPELRAFDVDEQDRAVAWLTEDVLVS